MKKRFKRLKDARRPLRGLGMTATDLLGITANRRQFVRGALGSTLGLGLGSAPSWLGSRAFGQDESSVPLILMVHCGGGWDQSMVFDDQIGSSYVDQESGAQSATGAGGIKFVDHADRPAVKNFFDAYGANAAIVNGLSVGAMTSERALINCYTAIPKGKRRPVDFLTYYTASLNPVLEIPHAIIKAPYSPGDYASVGVRISESSLEGYLTAAPGVEPIGDALEEALAVFQEDAYAAALKRAANNTRDAEKLKGLFYGQARHTTIEARLLEVDAALGPIGADSEFLRDGKRAVELFAAGAGQCVSISCGGPRAFDTPRDHFAKQSALFESLFSDLDAILQYAFTRDVASNMILIVTSELGKAPRLDAAGGKGPWAYTSMLLWGVGIAGGTVVNASDATLRGLPINPVFGESSDNNDVTIGPKNVFAAIFLKNGVPMRLIVDGVQPLSAILASG